MTGHGGTTNGGTPRRALTSLELVARDRVMVVRRLHGATLREIASEFDLTERHVSRRLEAWNIGVRRLTDRGEADEVQRVMRMGELGSWQ
jgi:hypothetical protein